MATCLITLKLVVDGPLQHDVVKEIVEDALDSGGGSVEVLSITEVLTNPEYGCCQAEERLTPDGICLNCGWVPPEKEGSA